MLYWNIRSIPLSLSARAAQILVIKSCGGHFEKCLGADGFCNKFHFESVFHLMSSYYIRKYRATAIPKKNFYLLPLFEFGEKTVGSSAPLEPALNFTLPLSAAFSCSRETESVLQHRLCVRLRQSSRKAS